jgi:hypothetical protein
MHADLMSAKDSDPDIIMGGDAYALGKETPNEDRNYCG